MKKSILLCTIMLGYYYASAQTLNPSVAVAESGQEITVTAQYESNVSYIGVLYSGFISPTNSPIEFVSITPISFYSLTSLNATKFKIVLKNTTTQAQTATVWIKLALNNDVTSQQSQSQLSFNIKVNPKVTTPTTYYNIAKSTPFTKNNCDQGTAGTSVTYTVPANTYSSTISQADADSKAQNDINNNGQAYANANGECLTAYYNTETSGSFTKNDCGSGYSGSVVTYVIPARKYQSTVSQLAADQLAINDLNSNGQINANNIGTCSEVRKRYRAALRREGACNSSVESNTFIWIREDYDLNNLGSSLNSIDAYTSQTGETKIIDGSYKIMYSIKNSENPEQGVRIFSVLNGSINGYYLCNE